MEKDSLEGYVYIVTNPSYNETVKIGLTHGQKHPSLRVKELSKSTEVLEGFKCEWYMKVSDCKLAEALLHNHFHSYRIKSNKEFFQITLDKAILESEETLYNFFKSLDSDRFCSIQVQFSPNTNVGNELIDDKNAILQKINYPSLLTNIQIVDITDRVKECWSAYEIISLKILQVDSVGIWLEITVKERIGFLCEFSQRINICDFRPTQLNLFFNDNFDLNESIEKNTEVLIYNLREIFSSYSLMNEELLCDLIQDFGDYKIENTINEEEEIELQDFEDFIEEIRDSCLTILDIINNNLKTYKITDKTKKKALLDLSNTLSNLSNVPDYEYLLEIDYKVKNEIETECKHWSIELGHAFIVESYVRTYQSGIGGDTFRTFYYSQNRNESYLIEGYFSTWFEELESLLQSQYADKLSIEISFSEL